MNTLLLWIGVASAGDADWTLEPSRISWLGGQITRIHASHDGLPLDAPPEVIFHDTAGSIVAARGSRPLLLPQNLTPGVPLADAAAHAAAQWHAPMPTRGTLVLRQDGDSARLAWRLRIAAADQLWRTWVDAHTGEVIASEADSWSAQAWIYDPNPAAAELTTTELLGLQDSQRIIGHYAFATDCIDWRIDPRPYGERVCIDWAHAAKADPDGDYFIEPHHGELDDPFVEPQAYYHTDRIARWAQERFGVYLGYSLQIFTNFPLTNAFFGDFDDDGDRDLSFGISDDGYNFAYDSDVVYHEFGHGIVREVAGSMWMQADTLGIDWTPGALNEGVADTFAMLLNPDPLLAESLGASDKWDLAIRVLDEDRVCPDDLHSQVHRSGEIWGSLAWNLISDPRIGQDLTADLLVGSIATWGNGTNWDDAGWSLIDTADTLLNDGLIDDETHEAVNGHVSASGMLDCERIIDLAKVQSSRQYLLNLGLAEAYERIPAGVQFQYLVPAEANELQIEINEFTGPEVQTGLAVYVRAGSPVEHETTRIEGLGLHHAIPVVYDAVFEIDETTGTIVLNQASEPPLVPAENYYWSIASINRGRPPMDVAYSRTTLSARALTGRSIEQTEPLGSGCATQAAPRMQPPWCLIVLSLMVGTRRQVRKHANRTTSDKTKGIHKHR